MNEENPQNQTANQKKKRWESESFWDANRVIWMKLEQPQIRFEQIESLNSFCDSA
jgi:hypothetical protein